MITTQTTSRTEGAHVAPSRALNLDVLIRVSQRKDEAKSPDQQLDICKRSAASNGYTIGMVHDSGKSESGKTMDRDAVRLAMDRIRIGQTDGVMVAFLDRFGRAPIEEAMAVVREIHNAGGVLVPADVGGMPIDPEDPMAETNLVMQLQFARQYWLTRRNGWKRSQSDAIKRGVYPAAAPLGYVHGPDKRLALDPVNAPTIQEAYKRAARDGIQAAAKYLARDTDATRKILAKRVYLGEIHHTSATNLNAHPALVDLATWSAAQSEARDRKRNDIYPLSGIARCADCGGPMVGHMARDRTGKTTRRYRCSNRWNGGKHPCTGGAYATADKLEALVRAPIAQAIDSYRFTVGMGSNGLSEAQSALETAEAEVTRWVQDLEMRDIIGAEAYKAGAQARSQAAELARKRYQAEAASVASTVDLPAADELDRPDQLKRAAAHLVMVSIASGRAPISDRVSISWLD